MLGLLKAALIVVVMLGEVAFLAGSALKANTAPGVRTERAPSMIGTAGFLVVMAAGIPLILLLVTVR